MSENSAEDNQKDRPPLRALSPAEISQLLLACSLSATQPLLALIKCLIAERIVDGARLVAVLEPALSKQNLPPATKAMLDPLWASFLAEVTKAGGSTVS